jgi:selenide,water dikinase
MAPGDLERVLKTLPADPWAAGRLLTSSGRNEDASIVRIPAGKALVQTVDFFTPIVNDPYKFGQIAAANALSDVYAMGGDPWCAMNIVCFPAKSLDITVLAAILAGGADKTAEAGAALAGGHSVEDPEVKFGLAVTGIITPDAFADNGSLRPDDQLVVTKALGTGLLATAIKGRRSGHQELEDILYRSAARLNAAPGRVIRSLGIKAATDITGFGLGGHLLEMLDASDLAAVIHAGRLAMLPYALQLAAEGFLPGGSHANRMHRQNDYNADSTDALLTDIIFDAQTSGGIILAVPPAQVNEVLARLRDDGEIADVIGEVLPHVPGKPRLTILP